MIVNPSTYSFDPPANIAPVSGYNMRIRRVDDNTIVSEYPLAANELGGTFIVIRPQLLAAGYAGVELKLTVRSVGYGGLESGEVQGLPTFSFQPAPDPPSNVVIAA